MLWIVLDLLSDQCVCAFCRITAAHQTTATAQSVLSDPFAPDTMSQQPRVRGSLLQTRMPTLSPAQVEKMPGSPPRHLSRREKSITTPSGAWAAHKPVSKACHSLSSQAHRLFPQAPNQPSFLRRSTWQTTGWRMIWRKSSRRKRGGFESSRMGLEGMTAPLLQRFKTDT